MTLLNRIAILFSCLTASCVLADELTFTSKSLRLAPKTLGDPAVTFNFDFINNNKHAVVITDVTPDCGCTEVVLESTTIAPGQAGVLVGSVDMAKGRIGKPIGIAIKTKGSDEPIRLMMTIDAPKDAIFVKPPRFLIWKVGEPAEAKKVLIRVNPSSGLEITSLAINNARFSATVTEDGDRVGDFWITVKPIDTGEVSGAVIEPTDAKVSKYVDLIKVYAYVMR